MKIRTELECVGYVAYDDDRCGCEKCCVAGIGKTREDAILDLLEQLEERGSVSHATPRP
jgi:hypothetical protein